MRVLFDHCVPKRLRRHLGNHEVKTTHEIGWAEYKNGALLAAAETADFDLFLTVDRNLIYQQNLSGRAIAVIVLAAHSNTLEALLPLVPQIEATLDDIQPGEFVLIERQEKR